MATDNKEDMENGGKRQPFNHLATNAYNGPMVISKDRVTLSETFRGSSKAAASPDKKTLLKHNLHAGQ